MIKPGSSFKNKKLFFSLFLFLDILGVSLFFLNRNPFSLSQFFDRLPIRTAFQLHHKLKNIPSYSAAKTVIDPFFRAHHKRGGFLLMKRTVRFIVFASAF